MLLTPSLGNIKNVHIFSSRRPLRLLHIRHHLSYPLVLFDIVSVGTIRSSVAFISLLSIISGLSSFIIIFVNHHLRRNGNYFPCASQRKC